ncbi:MAG: hypothetical protein VCE75_15210, partial [Alphaproteobacteria bacterium]
LALCRSAITCDDGPGREVILYDHDAEPSEEAYGLDFAVARKIVGAGYYNLYIRRCCVLVIRAFRQLVEV